MPTHTVQQGEHISRIAEHYGFHDSGVIWDHPSNAALREQRQNPSVLLPGDQLFVPEKQVKKVVCATTNTHRFRLHAEPVLLRLVLRDLNSDPIANTPCTLEVNGQIYELTSGADGLVEQKIPRTAESGRLTFGQLVIPLQIGHLDPVAEVSGWRARLNNLGYNAGKSDDPLDPQLQSAVEEFQIDYELTVDGMCGPNTQAKLKEVHGC
jgi:hypothetical protein